MKCIVLVLVALLLSPLSARADQILIGTGVSVANEVLKPIETAFERSTGHKLLVLEKGPFAALTALDSGRIDAAGIVYSPQEIKEFFKEKNKAFEENKFKRQVVGTGKVVVITNKRVPVKKLSKEQIRGLLTGKIQNWKDVGGPNLPVLTVLGRNAQGINNLYRQKILGDQEFQRDITDAGTGSDVKHQVAMNEGAIGIVTLGLANGDVHLPEQPDVAFTMSLYTKGNPSPKVQELLKHIAQKK